MNSAALVKPPPSTDGSRWPSDSIFNDSPKVPNLSHDLDTCAAALAYAQGQLYVLPIKSGTKDPGSRVGQRWQTKSTRDPQTIVGYWAGTNDGIALHAGRSGLVIFDIDHPELVPPMLRDAIDTCRPPMQESDPTQPGRGHVLFRQPPGRKFGNGTGRLGKGWGEVRGSNGVIVVAPSLHERAKQGAAYSWARTGRIPVLPDSVAELLDDATDAVDAVSDTEVATFATEHRQAGRPELLEMWASMFEREVAAGGSRHDAMVSKAVGALKEARAGYFDAGVALAQLRAAFVNAVVAEPIGAHQGSARTPQQAEGEWSGIVAWAVAQARAADLNEVRARVAQKAPIHDPCTLVAAPGPPTGVDSETGEVLATSAVNLPREFWEATGPLTHIRQAAHSRVQSPDALLGVVLARVSAGTDPSLHLPAIVGSSGSPNVAVALVGPPGSGKSSTKDIAMELVPLSGDDLADDMSLGSGEGIIETYFEIREVEEENHGVKKKVKRKVQTKRRVFMYLDEGQALAGLGDRKGSTLMESIRSMWSGGTTGQANARNETKRHLLKGQYRLALVVGFQPQHAVGLLNDAGGGTPQRFLWFNAVDPAIPDNLPPWPGGLAWEPPEQRAYAGAVIGHEITVPQHVSDEIQRAKLVVSRGEVVVRTLDAHHHYSRLKVAALLALLHGRDGVTSMDWELSDIVMTTSIAVRSSIVAEAAAAAQQREFAGHRVAARRVAVVEETQAEGARRRMARTMANRAHREGPTSVLKRSDLTGSTRSTDRRNASYDEALALAEAEGWLVRVDDTYKPGSTRPA